MKAKKTRFVSKLLAWRNSTCFHLPWRETSDPYRMLLSELFLRKTSRKQVKQIYAQFFSKYPDIQALSTADIDAIRKVIRPLGMGFVRAVALKNIAEIILRKHDGRIPNDREELLELPHVGSYIANAVMCFAFGKRVPIVDTNVIRVYERVFSLKSRKSRPQTDKEIWDFAEKALPLENYVEYNYALIDFGSEICRFKNPLCNVCIARTICTNFVQ